MKPKGLLIAVVLLAVLGGAIWWSNRAEAKKAAKGTDTSTKILSIPDDQIQEIHIKKGKLWRIHYWILRTNRIKKLAMGTVPKEEAGVFAYDDLPAEVWDRPPIPK